MKELQSPSSIYSFDFSNQPWHSTHRLTNALHRLSRRRCIRQITLIFLSVMLLSWTWLFFARSTLRQSSDILTVRPSLPLAVEDQSILCNTAGEGVDLDMLLNLPRIPARPNETVSIVLIAGPNTQMQLDVLHQSTSAVFHDNRTRIYLLTDPTDDHHQVLYKDVGVRVHPVPLGASLDQVPLLAGSNILASDYVWVLDPGAVPGERYFEWMYDLAHTGPYADAVLGTHAMLLPANVLHDPRDPVCLDSTSANITQMADMVLGAWLVRRTWLDALLHDQEDQGAPLAFRLGQRHPAIKVPTRPDPAYQIRSTHCHATIASYRQDDPAWRRVLARHATPTHMDRLSKTVSAQHRLVFWADNAQHLMALLPLVERFKAIPSIEMHVIYLGGQDAMQWPHDARMLHILSQATPQHRKKQLIDILTPRVVIRTAGEDPSSQDVALLRQNGDSTVISLPVDEIPHALWMADLPLDALAQWNKMRIELVVITDRRPQSLDRLLQSLRRGMYLGDSVGLMIHLEQTADPATQMVTQAFVWRHGLKTIRHRIRKGGLMPAIVESWYPSSNDEYAVLLEDDIEVSPLFYVWAKYAILKYRYSNDRAMGGHPELFGVSLYSPKHLELLPQGRRPFDPSKRIKDHSPYLTPVPCSWGAVYFPEHWREFHGYLIGRLAMPTSSTDITVPESRSNRWKKSWKKYFIELVYLRAYVMLYPNFERFESFSTNHLEIGTHVKDGRRPQSTMDAFRVPLMDHDTILAQLPSHKLPTFHALPVLDLWGNPTSLNRLEATAAAWHPGVSTCERRTGTFNPADLLCPYPAMKENNKKKKKASTGKEGQKQGDKH